MQVENVKATCGDDAREGVGPIDGQSIAIVDDDDDLDDDDDDDDERGRASSRKMSVN